VNLFNRLLKEMSHLTRTQLIAGSNYPNSQFYTWLKAGSDGIGDRKPRDCKPVSREVVRQAVEVIGKYPHFSAAKGQSYMLYHQLGYIPQHLYKSLKKIVKQVIFQEVSNRKLLPQRTSYEHERPGNPGEIWAEDFTHLRVRGKKFYAALVMDVAMNYYLGCKVSLRPDDNMVKEPVNQALTLTGGKGPKRFLLSDNGPQYISNSHGDLLDKLNIIQKRIPSCKPEYNGSIECGMKEIKNVFYNVWAEIEEQGLGQLKDNDILTVVQMAMDETCKKMNEEIPRPCLNGVTPIDVLNGIANQRIEKNMIYLETELARKEVMEPWNKKDWEIVKTHLRKRIRSNLELMTKFCFFLKRPFPKIEKLDWKVLGN